MMIMPDNEMNFKSWCRVILRDSTRAFDREYTYAIPGRMKQDIAVGSRVLVPFGKGNRSAEAYVASLLSEPSTDFQIKPLLEVLAPGPVLLPDQIRLAGKMRRRYLCTYGDAIKCMVPAAVAAVNDKKVMMAELADPADAARRLADGEIDRLGQIRIVEQLLETETAPVQELAAACQVSRSVISTLRKNGFIRTWESEKPLEQQEENWPQSEDWEPVPEQKKAIERITRALTYCETDLDSCSEFLLFGVTGSGKTEVYLQAARQTIAMGRSVLILVPEIALTPQMISRMRSRFGNNVAVLHSRLTPSQRYQQWQLVLRGETKVVVGARSAVFAPLRDIGLIILDEEQETTYKSETHPRYHARDIARMRALEHGSVLVLGSATPSVETFYRSENGKTVKLVLPERIGRHGLAKTEIVDMRRELGQGNRDIFSRKLTDELKNAFAAGEQAIIFINRRGYAGFVLCRKCGHVVKCDNCSVSLTSHYNVHAPAESGSREQLICHYCGKVSYPPHVCPVCGSRMIGRFGAGTQQVEEHFNEIFAPYKAIRMDQDTTSGRTAHASILAKFAAGEAQALIGTQMIAKGHDFPNVSVVGILAADLMLGISDFRASERAFQLITQAAGRAGRGDVPGKVIIQAYNIDDYAVRSAAAQDYNAFYRQEIAYRKLMGYPPYGSICSITISGRSESETSEKCQKLASALRARKDEDADFEAIELMSAARAPLYQIRGRYRWRLVIKAAQPELIARYLMPVTDHFGFGNTAVSVDLDPYQML